MSRRPSNHGNQGKKNNSNARLGYLPGLDGLRAFAVIAVLLYHADLNWIPGGFLGVEIFFVISGYLITSLLLIEWQANGRIDLKGFWMRRARRLLPALFLLLGSTLTFAVIFLPGEVASLRNDVAAALGYSTNWYLILSNKSYFEAVGRPPLLQHLWSLAVEEQFYVLWPLLLAFFLRRVRENRLLYLILAGAIASSLAMAVLYSPDVDPSRVYYGTDTRASGLLLGAALAFVWRPWQKASQARLFDTNLLDLSGLAGLGVLVWACLRINEYDPFLYQGGFAVVSLATALVIAVAVHPRARLGKRFLAFGPLVWVGVRSYGIYLWHWPVFDVTRPQLDVQIDGLPLLALRFGITFVLAGLSYKLVETPIRTGGLGKAWKALREARGWRRGAMGLGWAGAVSGLAVFLVVLGQTVAAAQPPPPPAYLAELAQPTPVVAENPLLPAVPPAAAAESTEESDTVSSASLPPSELLSEPTVAPLEEVGSSLTTGAPGGAIGSVDLSESMMKRPTVTAESSAAVSVATPADSNASAAVATPRPTVPTPTPLVSGVSVTAIGDSVMLGAAPALRQAIAGIDVDAQLSRQVGAGLSIIQARAGAGTLGSVVIVHMGTNGTFSARQFDAMMQAMQGVQRVIFINDKVPRPWQDMNNAVLAAGVARYPGQAVLLDWHTISQSHPDYFWGDGIHLRPEGAKFYAGLIAALISQPM